MPLNPDNAIEYALMKVNNKGLGSRVKNSAFFHSTRSAFSGGGSFFSKGSGVVLAVGRAALKLIPIPVVGDLCGKVVSVVEGKVRNKHHEVRLRKAVEAGDLSAQVKFELKELSVEELDRYRWKLHDALQDINKAVGQFNAKAATAAAEGKACDPMLEMALTIAQAKRRHFKITQHVTELEEALARAKEWANNCNTSIQQVETEFRTFHSKRIAEDFLADDDGASCHTGCGDYCYYHGTRKEDNWIVTKNRLAMLARELSAPLSAEDFMSLDGSDYEMS